MTTKVLVSGHWQEAQECGKVQVHMWSVGQIVNVQSRTWIGINRPGGHGRIQKLHYSEDGQIASMDVKYTLSGTDKFLEPYLVEPWQELDRSQRSRRDANNKLTPPPPPSPCQTLSKARLQQQKQQRMAIGDEKENHQPQTVGPQQQRPLPQRVLPVSHNNGARKKSRMRLSSTPTEFKQPRSSIPQKLLAASLQTSKKLKQQKTVEPSIPVAKVAAGETSLNSVKESQSAKVPQFIFADDEMSIVSELDIGIGVEEPHNMRSHLLQSKQVNTGLEAEGRELGIGGRPRDTTATTETSQFSFRSSSPCSKAKSIVSGIVQPWDTTAMTRSSSCGAVLGNASSSHVHLLIPPLVQPGDPQRQEFGLRSPTASKSLFVGTIPAVQQSLESSDPLCDSLPLVSPKLITPDLPSVTEQQEPEHRDDDDDVDDGNIQDSNDDYDHEPAVTTTMALSNDSLRRRNWFVTHLVELLRQHDHVVHEDKVLDLINIRIAKRAASVGGEGAVQVSPPHPPLNTEEMKQWLTDLCDDDKIMRSEGRIFGIVW